MYTGSESVIEFSFPDKLAKSMRLQLGLLSGFMETRGIVIHQVVLL